MSRRTIHNLITAAAILVPWLFASWRPSSAQMPPISLVRIDPRSPQETASLAELGLLASNWLSASDGRPFILVEADPSALQALQQGSYLYTILDPDARGAEYTLLSGSEKALRAAAKTAPLLLLEPPLGLARSLPAARSRWIALGLDLSPLVFHPLAAPRPDIRFEAEALPQAAAPSFMVAEMLPQISALGLFASVSGLSGEEPVTIAGSPYTLLTRYSRTDVPITKATRFAHDLLQSYGLLTWYDYYSLYGSEKRSVLAQQTGLDHPEKVFLLTAHLDSTSYVNGDSYTYAPGADDNASGSAALLAIAEILSQYDFACTLRYALFTGEEQGMIGSQAYAADVYYQAEDLQAVLNLDMLGYSTPGSLSTIELHTRYSNSGDLAIANLFRDVISAYDLDLQPLVLQDGKTFSDHSSFWDYGYPAVMAIEDWNDHTPNYHKTSDQVENLNLPYYKEFSRAALAAFAHLGCLYDGRLAGTIRDLDSNQPIEGASIEAWQAGKLIRSTTSQSDGSYTFDLKSGVYDLQFHAADHLSAAFPATQVGKTAPLSLDPMLEPCLFVGDIAATASPVFAQVGETVSFGAEASGEPPLVFGWDFGDGHSAEGAAVSHTFASQGAFPVSLQVSNACGSPQTVFVPVFVDVQRFFMPLVANQSAQ